MHKNPQSLEEKREQSYKIKEKKNQSKTEKSIIIRVKLGRAGLLTVFEVSLEEFKSEIRLNLSNLLEIFILTR